LVGCWKKRGRGAKQRAVKERLQPRRARLSVTPLLPSKSYLRHWPTRPRRYRSPSRGQPEHGRDRWGADSFGRDDKRVSGEQAKHNVAALFFSPLCSPWRPLHGSPPITKGTIHTHAAHPRPPLMGSGVRPALHERAEFALPNASCCWPDSDGKQEHAAAARPATRLFSPTS